MTSPLIAYPEGPESARVAPDVVAEMFGLSDPEVLLGWTPEHRPWLESPTLRGRTFMAGYQLAPAIADGRLRYVPVRLSAVPRLAAQAEPDVVVVSAVRRGSDLAFLGTVGWGPAAARAAGSVVVEVDEDAADLGGPLIPGRITEVISRERYAAEPPIARRADEIDLAIGRNVVSILPEEPTLQFGPGGIGEGIVASLDRPVRIWSGLVTDPMADLLTNGLLIGDVTAGYVWGGEPIVGLAQAGRLHLLPIEETHDLTRVSAIPRFVACNTALQLGLDGSVNVERVGGRLVAGIGGHADFCMAAARAPAGISVIAFRSTTRGGASTILPRVEVVSTPRCDVQVVVTEHGVADLRDVDDAERVRRIIEVADPSHRDRLRADGS